MLQKMRVLLLVCITAVLAACGGGGGDETPNFAGTYAISTLSLNSNNCNAALPSTIAGGADLLTQNGRAVAFGSGGTILNGSVDADNGGFTVSMTQVSNGIPVLSTFAFRTITAGSKYELRFTMTAGACSAAYVGTATKI